jgi:hypothetical protein
LFVSGISTGLSKFNLTLTDITFDKVKGTIGATLFNVSKKIEQITLSYTIFFNPIPNINELFTNNPGYRQPFPADYVFRGSIGFIQGNSVSVWNGMIVINTQFGSCVGNCTSKCITTS